MSEISNWILQITGIVLCGVLVEVLLPKGKLNKILKTILALFIVLVIIAPLKNSDIAIMDITSNGGNIVPGEKYGLFQDLVCIKNKEDEKEENTFSKNDEQLSMDNFLDSFKL